jgi:two-component system, NarL family, response regulator NreC
MPAPLQPGCVLVAHGHQRLSEGLRGWLQAMFAGVFIVADQPSLITGTHKLQPALLVIDLALAGGELPTLLAELRGQSPDSRTLLLSDYDDARADASILSAGADGVVHTATLAADFSTAVDAVLAGRRFISPPGAH